MQRKQKICLGCGLPKYIFGHGLCDICYRRNKGKGFLRSKHREPTGELEMFNQIWNERPHRSEISNQQLLPYGHELWVNQFCHNLPKKLYEEFRLNKANIFLALPEEHTLYDNFIHKIIGYDGTIFLPQWKPILDKRDELLAEYNVLIKKIG